MRGSCGLQAAVDNADGSPCADAVSSPLNDQCPVQRCPTPIVYASLGTVEYFIFPARWERLCYGV
jgi:hypothetical protein